MIDNLLNILNFHINSLGGTELPIDNEFKENISLDKSYKVKSWLWNVPGYRRWRVTSFKAGSKIQVLNSVASPNYNNDQPIMGIDILWFPKRDKLIAILDFQPLLQKDSYLQMYCSSLKEIEIFSEKFDNGPMKNIYDLDKFFSPWLILCRGNKSHAEKYLPQILNQFLTKYIIISAQNNESNFLNFDQIKQKHIEYDNYNKEKDPAIGLFQGFFGKEWAENYIDNFLFPLSND